MKIITRPTLAALALGAAFFATSAPAHAAKCFYVAYDMHNNLFVEAAVALKMSNACNRARRQCNRKLDRWSNQGKVARGSGCAKMK